MAEQIQEEELMTAEEVAEVYKVTVGSVYQMKKRGLLPAVDLGTASVRFRRSDVMAKIRPKAEPAEAV